MKYHYDLHIHSVLSPCADVLMTPNNILNMASLKGLDILAVTDHNSLKQQSVIAEIAESFSFLLLYGAEVHLREGCHVLVYFKTLRDALRFDQELESRIDKTAHPGPEEEKARLTDIEDFIIGELPYPTNRPLALTLPELCDMLKNYDHLRFFAHVDRPLSGGWDVLRKTSMNGIEISPFASADFLSKNGWNDFRVLHNSDAHQLMDINEKTTANVVELPKLTVDCLFEAFRS